jgi:hypothetical protein
VRNLLIAGAVVLAIMLSLAAVVVMVVVRVFQAIGRL